MLRLRCSICNKIKNTENNYTENVKYALKYEIDGKGQQAVATFDARCSGCTDTSRVEIECTDCGEIKGLDSFNKTQRKNSDEAVRGPYALHKVEMP